MNLKTLWTKMSHKHRWTQTYNYTSANKMYAHEHYVCSCGYEKHIKRYWNRKQVTKLIPQTIDK